MKKYALSFTALRCASVPCISRCLERRSSNGKCVRSLSPLCMFSSDEHALLLLPLLLLQIVESVSLWRQQHRIVPTCNFGRTYVLAKGIFAVGSRHTHTTARRCAYLCPFHAILCNMYEYARVYCSALPSGVFFCNFVGREQSLAETRGGFSALFTQSWPYLFACVRNPAPKRLFLRLATPCK